jgi:hypothetical protein
MPHYEPKDWTNTIHWVTPLRNKIKELWSLTWLLAAYEETCELSKTPFDYRPFQAPSISLMLLRISDYTYDHVKEMGKAMKHSEKIGEDDDELLKEEDNEGTDS